MSYKFLKWRLTQSYSTNFMNIPSPLLYNLAQLDNKGIQCLKMKSSPKTSQRTPPDLIRRVLVDRRRGTYHSLKCRFPPCFCKEFSPYSPSSAIQLPIIWQTRVTLFQASQIFTLVVPLMSQVVDFVGFQKIS